MKGLAVRKFTGKIFFMSWAKKIREGQPREEHRSQTGFAPLVKLTRPGLKNFEEITSKNVARLVTRYHRLSGLSAEDFLALLRREAKR